MTEAVMIGSSANHLVIHPPTDTEGGYVWEVGVDLVGDGIAASGMVDVARPRVEVHGVAESLDLVGFVEGLARDWRGWKGIRRWRSLCGRLRLEAEHDGAGHVSMTATLTGPTAGHDTWSARLTVVVEAGEQLSQLAAAVGSLLMQRNDLTLD